MSLVFVLFPRTEPPPAQDDGRGHSLAYEPDQTLAEALYLSGRVRPPGLCSGLARCGRCALRVLYSPSPCTPTEADERFFSPEERASGLRLGCRHAPQPGMVVELPQGVLLPDVPALSGVSRADGSNAAPAAAPIPVAAVSGSASAATPVAATPVAAPPDKGFYLAVDLGTTSLVWRLCAPDGGLVGQGSENNPQSGAGSEVVSRLAYALRPGGGYRLQKLTHNCLRRLTAQAQERCPEPIGSLCLAANPAMTVITCGFDPAPLAFAPYALPESGGRWLGLPDLPPLWLPPQLSPFVGGDISAGYAALALRPQSQSLRYPFLLADMGTNGEFLLCLSADRALSASVALGPALEGIGLSCGTQARLGAAADFVLTAQGLAAHVLDKDGKLLPAGQAAACGQGADRLPGITGTGYLALLHLLLQCGALDRDGRFTPDKAAGFGRFLAPEKDMHGQEALALPGGLRLFAVDVEELLKVKAAFSLGLRCLLDKAGLGAHRLEAIYLAGALGRHVRKEALETLGFVPPGAAGRLLAVGNTALEGAALLGASAEARHELAAWAKGVQSLALAEDAAFGRDFAAHMRFAW